MASQMSPYEYYLDLLGHWSTNIALPSQWFINFHLDSVNCLKGNLQGQLNNYESHGNGWTISSDTIKYLTSKRLQGASENLMGCVFAKELTLPGEAISGDHEGLEYGGYTAPLTISHRKSYPTLGVIFAETNASFLDMVIKPWSVLVGYNGFVARSKNSPKSVKCNQCDICLLAKTGSGSPMAIRKIYRFFNIAPLEVNSEVYSHQADALKTTSVQFGYDNYAILEEHTSSLITR